jgi:hypothetical protein
MSGPGRRPGPPPEYSTRVRVRVLAEWYTLVTAVAAGWQCGDHDSDRLR